MLCFVTFGLFTLTETDSDTDSDWDSKPDSYIALCRLYSHCTDLDSDPYSLLPYRTGIRVWVCTQVDLRLCKLAIYDYSCLKRSNVCFSPGTRNLDSREKLDFGLWLVTWLITARKQSCGKVMFLQLSVILFTGGGGALPQCMLGYHPPSIPPGAGTPRSSACWEIRLPSGWHASYWNAIWLTYECSHAPLRLIP